MNIFFYLPQRSAGTVNWQLWLSNSGVKLSQLAKTVAFYMDRKESIYWNFGVSLNGYLKITLLWYWAKQGQPTQYSDLHEDQQKLPETVREFLSPCEQNTGTQVWYIQTCTWFVSVAFFLKFDTG